MGLPADRATLRRESLINNHNPDTILFGDFFKPFNNVIEPPDVREEELLSPAFL